MASRALRRRASYRAINGHARTRRHPILRLLLVLLVAFIMLTSGASAGTIFFYGSSLPTVKNFEQRFEFQNTRIRDSQGNVLYDMADLAHGHGSRVVEPLYQPGHTTAYYHSRGYDWLVGDAPAGSGPPHGIPLVLQNATIATEDASFWSNWGFDPLSIARAEYDNVTQGHVVSGASTITQQLVREYMLKPDPTLTRKTQEIVLSAELTRKYPKSKILWYYLNSVPYGSLPYGAEAATEIYFPHEHVWNLDLAQAALLAGLPEAPSVFDPINNRSAALARERYVLHLMYVHGYLVDSHGHPDPSLITKAMKEANGFKFVAPTTIKKDPHFVQYVLNQLQSIPALKGKIYNGLDVWTTLNPKLQATAQSIVQGQVSQLGGYNVTDGALVSEDLRPDCYGCILAMVGSADYNNKAIAGQINMADTPRQPGSSFKPFNYIYGFQNGLAPGTTVLDGPLSIPDTGNAADGGWYQPTDYDHQWHGVVTLRVALDNSLNIPAIKVEQYGASLTNQGLHAIRDQAMKMGITSIKSDNPTCCGWALTLGGMEHGVRLVEETSAYGAFATGGVTAPPISIRRVYDRTTHKLLYGWKQDEPVKPQRVLAPKYAYLMNNVLSDNSSRCTPVVCEFGLTSPLYLGRPAAAKTGTTESFTDNWTVGYTPQIVTGVWVGNADNTAMVGTTGVTGAAPIWNAFMLAAFKELNLPPIGFQQPSDVYFGSMCRVPGPYTSFSNTVSDIYAAGQIPLCSVGTYNTGVPVAPPPSAYQPPAAAPQTNQPVAPAAPVQPVAPAPTAVPQAPVVQPSSPPAAAQPPTTGQSPASPSSPPAQGPGQSTGAPP